MRKILALTLGLALAAGGVAIASAANAAMPGPKPPTAKELLARAGKGCSVISSGKLSTDAGRSGSVAICRSGTAVSFKADLDVDCDGVKTTQCAGDGTRGTDTSLHTSKNKPFNPVASHYYVLPMTSSSKFNYARHGIKLGDVAAIIYHDKVVYAVFADVGPANVVGEASYSVAKDLGINPDPNRGGVDSGVTYVVFPGARPAPVESDAKITKRGQVSATYWVKN